MKKRLIFFAVLSILLLSWWLSAFNWDSAAVEAASISKVTLRVEGMT